MTESEQSQVAYSDFVSDGHYQAYRGGLAGKHDNVRIYWEDQIRGMRLHVVDYDPLTRIILYCFEGSLG